MRSQISGTEFMFMFGRLAPETLLVSVAILIGLARPQIGAEWFRKIEGLLGTLARKRTLSVCLCGFSAIALRLALQPWLPIPKPFINDEFSFLLGCDTFAHGRLTNPTHPMWAHLETFHVIFHPTYASMYPPLQGLVLAFGQVILGKPFWGICLSAGLMCAAICWMLQAWFPPSWALLGGMLPVLRFGVLSYWDNGYWGGALAATAGALVLGALPRIIRHQRISDSILMAFGIAMLANTRPYEGLMLSLVVGVRLFWWVWQTRAAHGQIARVFKDVVFPMLAVLTVAGAGTAYYFWRVTGSPLMMPQQLNRETYAVARYFYWQAAYPLHSYRHKAVQDFYTQTEFEYFQFGHTFRGILLQLATKLNMIWVFYFAPALTLPLFMFARVVRDRRVRFLVIAGAWGLGTSALVVFFNIHYVAVLTSIMLAVLIQGMRHLRVWRFEGKPSGLFLVRAIVIICVLMIPTQVRILGAVPPAGSWAAIGTERLAFEAQLRPLSGPQLILVRYQAGHDPLAEWVYNGADIDGQKVVWARDMGHAENAELLQYFRDRRVWLLDADEIPPKLQPYSDLAVVTPASGITEK